MAMRTDNFAEALDTPLRRVFFLEGTQAPTEHSRWCNTITLDRAFVDDYEVSGLGAVPAKAQGGSVTFEDAVEGGTKRYQPTPYALGFVITREMWDDDLHNIMRRMTQALRRSFTHLFDIEAYKIFNNATSTSSPYTGFRGEALLETDHEIIGTGGTIANKPSTDLDISYTAIQNAMLNYHNMVDRKGLPEFKVGRQIVTSGAEMFNASEILKNGPMQYGTANNNKNFVIDGPDNNSVNTEAVFSRFLTDTDRWFLLSEKSQHSLNLAVHTNPEFDMDDDFYTMNVLARGYARIISGWSDWRGVYGSTGA